MLLPRGASLTGSQRPANQQRSLQENNTAFSQKHSCVALHHLETSGWGEFLLQTERRGAMSIIAAAREQFYSQKVRRQDVGLALSWQ